MLPKLAEWHVYGNEQQGRFLTKYPEELTPTYYGTEITDDIKDNKFKRQLGKKAYELKDNLGNVRVTFSDVKMPTGSGLQPFRVDLLSKSEYYPYGMKINDLSYNATGARYGYNGTHEQDKELNADGNYLDFGNFGYDTRVAMRRNQEPLRAKYPSLSGYSIFNSNPIVYKDPDGYDAIILNATDGAGGLIGHAALLIGTDKGGWQYFSKNGTNSWPGAIGASDKNPRIGEVTYDNLNEFLSDKEIKVDGVYDRAFRITTTPKQDEIMKKAATLVVSTTYWLNGCSCIDVPSRALESIGLDPGYRINLYGPNNLSPWTNERYNNIVKNNDGVPLTNKLTPFVAPPIKRDLEIGPINKNINLDKEKNSIIPLRPNENFSPADNTKVGR